MIKVMPRDRKPSIYLKDNLSQTSAESGDQLEKQEIQQDQFDNKTHQNFNTKAKSSLCRNFMEKGTCPYGNKCQFAHGPTELKCNTDNQMSYKTRTCHAFARKGYCSYGSRCNFLHKAESSEVDLETPFRLRAVVYEGRRKNGSRLLEVLGCQ